MVATNSSEAPHHSSAPLAKRLSRNIAARRRNLKLTQAQLAERLGVDTETLSRFERGKHVPSLATLEQLAELLQTTVAELLEQEPKKANDEAMAITSWLANLAPDDRAFVQGLMKQCCDYLSGKATRT